MQTRRARSRAEAVTYLLSWPPIACVVILLDNNLVLTLTLALNHALWQTTNAGSALSVVFNSMLSTGNEALRWLDLDTFNTLAASLVEDMGHWVRNFDLADLFLALDLVLQHGDAELVLAVSSLVLIMRRSTALLTLTALTEAVGAHDTSLLLGALSPLLLWVLAIADLASGLVVKESSTQLTAASLGSLNLLTLSDGLSDTLELVVLVLATEDVLHHGEHVVAIEVSSLTTTARALVSAVLISHVAAHVAAVLASHVASHLTVVVASPAVVAALVLGSAEDGLLQLLLEQLLLLTILLEESLTAVSAVHLRSWDDLDNLWLLVANLNNVDV